jgi:phage terminase large subunit GpA-like protein
MPERLTPVEATVRYFKINNPGSYSGPYDPRQSPYMVEPLNATVDPKLSSVIFVGPAQSGKTESLILGLITHRIMCAQMDVILYGPSQTYMRDFSARRVDRMNHNSEDIGGRLLKTADADNKFDKFYEGMILTMSYPSINEMSGKPVPVVALTDYDRMPMNVGGEGSPFDLTQKRTTTFGSFAMAVAESSPSQEVIDPQAPRPTGHGAPATAGILALYEGGDKRWWYSPCPSCSHYFCVQWHHLRWDDSLKVDEEAAQTVCAHCPSCDTPIKTDSQFSMNLHGRWLKQGEAIDQEGRVQGQGIDTKRGSFWLFGTSAGFQSWPQLVVKYRQARKTLEDTGDDGPMRTFWNVDMAMPYYKPSLASGRSLELLKAGAKQYGTKEAPSAPPNSRSLLAVVDVQDRSFVVMVFAILPGTPFELAVVDRFVILKSRRKDHDGDPIFVEPHAVQEDWELVTEVGQRTYPVQGDAKGRHLKIRVTICDSGGRAGVTARAYQWWRDRRDAGEGHKYQLVKGEHILGAPRVRKGFPDKQEGARMAEARGDVPVLFLNSNLLKDDLNGRLAAKEPVEGSNRYLIPSWLPDAVIQELCYEVRLANGKWDKPTGAKKRNEAWDLSYYGLGYVLGSDVQIESVDWSAPPLDLAVLDKNVYACLKDPDGSLTSVSQGAQSSVLSLLAELGKELT